MCTQNSKISFSSRVGIGGRELKIKYRTGKNSSKNMHAAFHVSLSVLAAGDLQYIQECMVKMEY